MHYSNTDALRETLQRDEQHNLPDSPVMARYDICENKHHGDPQSVAANEKNLLVRGTQRQMVLEVIRSHSPSGITMKEVAALMGCQLNRVAGRRSELALGGWIEKTGEVRDGSAVMRVVP